jgi:nucleotide-binding universal stress UspA family protein
MDMATASAASTKSITVPTVNRNSSAFRDIVIPLVTHSNSQATNAYALSLAREFGSSVTGIAFAFDPIIPVSGPFDAVPGDIIEEMIARSEAEARENSLGFERQAKARGIDVTVKTTRAGFRESEDEFAESARSFDLAIAPQCSADDAGLPNFAEMALFQSGRPVIVVPFIHHGEFSLKRVMVCWDGSRAAARSISDAWPLLERAASIHIVTVGNKEKTSAIQQRLGEHFSNHGLSAQLESLSGEDIDAGNAILSHAADIGADLIVMGGYGHSKLREWVLGGVTHLVLQTMTIPVLVSH